MSQIQSGPVSGQPAIAQGAAYTPIAKGFHWLMALIWIGAWLGGMTAAHVWNPDHQVTVLHKEIASTILVLIVFRLLWRVTHRPPALPASMSSGMQTFAHLGHIALYAIALLALPISGWLMSSFADKPVMLAGLIKLPSLASPDKALAGLTHTFHAYTGWFCGLIVAGHVAFALKHHLVDRDDVLLRMSPARPPKA
jgi:cytochrome b561